MSDKPSLTDRIRRGEEIPWMVGIVLQAATPFVRWGMRRRLRMTPTRVNARVISFGNLTVGGTGKTPAVIERARQELEAQHRVAVLTRGYKSPAGSKSLASPDMTMPEQYLLLGDEPALMLQKVPDLIVIKDANRLRGAQIAIRRFQCNVLILDDGFQHTMISRDENILLIDAANPFGGGYILPRGILREPIEAMTRATQIVLTHWDQAKNPEELLATLQRIAPELPVRKTRHAPSGLRRLVDGEEVPLDTIKGQTIRAACAIGNPDAFFGTLESLGAEISERKSYLDHSDFSISPGAMTVVTEKDAMHLKSYPENTYALSIELVDCE